MMLPCFQFACMHVVACKFAMICMHEGDFMHEVDLLHACFCTCSVDGCMSVKTCSGQRGQPRNWPFLL